MASNLDFSLFTFHFSLNLPRILRFFTFHFSLFTYSACSPSWLRWLLAILVWHCPLLHPSPMIVIGVVTLLRKFPLPIFSQEDDTQGVTSLFVIEILMFVGQEPATLIIFPPFITKDLLHLSCCVIAELTFQIVLACYQVLKGRHPVFVNNNAVQTLSVARLCLCPSAWCEGKQNQEKIKSFHCY